MGSGFNLFKDWVDISITPPSKQWVTINVRGLVPDNATGVILRLSEHGYGNTACVRRIGSTINPTWMILTWKGHAWYFCGLVNHEFEVYFWVTNTTKIYLCGYTDEAVGFLPDLVKGRAGINDCSALVPNDATAGIWLIYNERTTGSPFAIAGYGSTDHHYDGSTYGMHATHICASGGEAHSFIYALVAFGEGKKMRFTDIFNEGLVRPYLLGYTRPPLYFFLNSILKSPTLNARWETIPAPELPANADGVIVEIRNCSPGHKPLSIRAPGSTNDDEAYTFQGLESALWGVCGVAGNQFETYNEFPAKSMYFIHGYTIPAGGPQEFVCPYCSQVFTTQDELNQHIADLHTFPCPYCELVFHTRESLNTHLASAHTFVCPYCSQVFTTQAELNQHIASAHTFHCPYCSQVFSTQDDLNQHIADAHTFLCPYCASTFHTQSELDSHIASTHTFVCSYCSLVFHTQEELNNHIALVHSTFTCPYCSQTFPTQDALNAHIQQAHLTCPYCGLVFNTQDELDQHIADIHDFPCPYCELVFHTQEDLEKHIQEEHREPVLALFIAVGAAIIAGLVAILKKHRANQ
jgi:uncharacterized C2H2 Zn-finger protein